MVARQSMVCEFSGGAWWELLLPFWDHHQSSTGVHYNIGCKDNSLIRHTSFGVLQLVHVCMYVCVLAGM